MILKIGMPKPARQPQPAKNIIQDASIHRIKRLDDISNKDVYLRTQDTSQGLLNIHSSGVPSLNRTLTPPSAEHTLRHPRPEPLLQMTQPNRGPKPVSDRENTERSLSQRSGVPISLRDHSDVGIQKPIRPNTILFNNRKNRSQLIKPSHRQSLELPPTPTVKASSSRFLTQNHITQHISTERRQPNLIKQRSEFLSNTPESIQVSTPLITPTKERQPGTPELRINSMWLNKNTRPTNRVTSVTNQKGGRRDQIGPKPPIGMHHRILHDPIPPIPNRRLFTRNYHLLHKVSNSIQSLFNTSLEAQKASARPFLQSSPIQTPHRASPHNPRPLLIKLQTSH